MVYMKGQVDNSKCESMNEWMSEHASGLIIWEGKCEANFEGWLDILEEQQSYIWWGRI